MKICVYAISKNEEKFCSRWVKSMSEADEIYVLDTGSTDNTVKALSDSGVHVSQKTISPWRFDVARNESLNLVPNDTDICVCTDLDEVFEEGWRQKLENAWQKGSTTSARYLYVWSHQNDKNGVTFFMQKIHARQGFSWINPVHEVLQFSGNENNIITLQDVTLHHYPDDKKSRSFYLPLLELAVKENPNNDRNVHYLGREYMFNGKTDLAISTLLTHLNMPSAKWKDERSASMRYIARCFRMTGRYDDAHVWYLRAHSEAPHIREPLVEYATLLFEQKDYYGVIFILNKALKISERLNTYITEPSAWGALPFDLLSLAYYNLGKKQLALTNIRSAISLSDEQRLKDNLNFFLAMAD